MGPGSSSAQGPRTPTPALAGRLPAFLARGDGPRPLPGKGVAWLGFHFPLVVQSGG